MTEEVGYVIMYQDCKGYPEYYRGCARGRDTKFSKTIFGAQIYKGKKSAMSTLMSSKLDNYRSNCKILRIKIEIEKEEEGVI